MSKNYLWIILLLLFGWLSLDRLPTEYQFWKDKQAWIKVQNISDKDIKDVSVRVWSQPHQLGTINQDMTRELTINRRSEISDVVLRFRYGSAVIERYVGTLGKDNHYQMEISVNDAGIVSVQEGTSQKVDATSK
jgi:hypothetical protein